MPTGKYPRVITAAGAERESKEVRAYGLQDNCLAFTENCLFTSYSVDTNNVKIASTEKNVNGVFDIDKGAVITEAPVAASGEAEDTSVTVSSEVIKEYCFAAKSGTVGELRAFGFCFDKSCIASEFDVIVEFENTSGAVVQRVLKFIDNRKTDILFNNMPYTDKVYAVKIRIYKALNSDVKINKVYGFAIKSPGTAFERVSYDT